MCVSLSVMFDSLWPHGLQPPGSSVHGILQARILAWVAILFSREIPDLEIKPNSEMKFSILLSQIKNLSPSFSPFITFWLNMHFIRCWQLISELNIRFKAGFEAVIIYEIIISFWKYIYTWYLYIYMHIQTWIWFSKTCELYVVLCFYHYVRFPYDYTVELRNRFKGLDLIDRVPDELWTEVCDTVQETGIQTIPMEKKCNKAKWLFGEALQIAVKRREVKSKGEKERYIHLNAEFQRIARRNKKAFFSDQCKEIEENKRMGKSRDLFKKLEIPREYFMQRWAR